MSNAQPQVLPAPPTSNDLLPCPFCGHAARLIHDTSADRERYRCWNVECANLGECEAELTGFASAEAVIAKWNSRQNGETMQSAAPARANRQSTWFMIGDSEYERLNPPVYESLLLNDGVYVKQIDNIGWLPVGHIPAPRTRVGWFVYHVVHGLAMRYRFLPVLVYSFREAFLND